MRRLIAVLWLAVAAGAPAGAQTSAAGEAELQKSEDRIAAVQRDLLSKYDTALAELQLAFQKAADLESAVAVRNERQRIAQEQVLAEKNLVVEPRALRNVQAQTMGRIQELVTQVVNDALPKLVELKKSLTVAGRLDEALSVRASIERLQNAHLPVVRPEPGSIVPAETLLQAYAADRARAEKTYKGQKMVVRGTIGGFRPDPAEGKSYQLFLVGSSSSGRVQCGFASSDYRFREEAGSFGVVILHIIPSGNPAAAMRIQKGQAFEVRGTCEGVDESVRLGKCELVR